jgi:uncharacterized cupin superfamily protein
MPREGKLEPTEHGLKATGEDGWFVANATAVRWRERPGRGAYCDFEGDMDFAQIGFNIQALGDGEPMGMYHWESNQEDFLVIAGLATLLVEGREQPLRQWDFVHCPAATNHIIIGGEGGCVVVAVGARSGSEEDWGGYTVDETASRLGAGVERATSDSDDAYARFPDTRFARYQPRWLPGEPPSSAGS